MDKEISAPIHRRGSDVKLIMEAVERGLPFLQYRDSEDELAILQIPDGGVSIGRSSDNQLALDWDREVSRVHAEIDRRGSQWVISDEGLARNGTFVDGEKVVGRRKLVDQALIRCGKTILLFRDPGGDTASDTTHVGSMASAVPELTNTQMGVLVALSRPVLASDRDGSTPATNQEIADELFLSLDGVKGHLRVLFQKFGIADLPQNRKRSALVERAMISGLVRGGSD